MFSQHWAVCTWCSSVQAWLPTPCLPSPRVPSWRGEGWLVRPRPRTQQSWCITVAFACYAAKHLEKGQGDSRVSWYKEPWQVHGEEAGYQNLPPDFWSGGPPLPPKGLVTMPRSLDRQGHEDVTVTVTAECHFRCFAWFLNFQKSPEQSVQLPHPRHPGKKEILQSLGVLQLELCSAGCSYCYCCCCMPYLLNS